MKKAAKRAKSKSSSRGAGVKSKASRSRKSRTSSKAKKTLTSSARSKLKRGAKKAAKAAIVAGSMAALDTALNELNPRKNEREGATPDESTRSDKGKSTR